MHKLGYSEAEANKIKAQVQYYSDLRETIKQASGDYLTSSVLNQGCVSSWTCIWMPIQVRKFQILRINRL